MLFTVLLAATMPLQWNPGYRTDVPYELELVSAKLERLAGVAAGCGFAVRADGKPVEVTTLVGREPGARVLRFDVPAGTKALDLMTCDGRDARRPSAELDGRDARRPSAEFDGRDARRPSADLRCPNLFAGALDVARWSCEGTQKEAISGGVKLSAQSAGTKRAICEIDLGRTADAAPLPVAMELDVKSVASMTWGAMITFCQFDAAGNELPEHVVDGRWTTEMLPPGKAVAFRERGLIHPRARKIVLKVEMLSRDRTVDEFGLARKPGPDAYPQLEITRLAMRPAAELPFPKYDAEKFFGAGVSGAADDRSLKIGDGQAFWYQARGRGSWARGVHYRDEKDIFFPSGAGTVEAWFKPDWSNAENRNFYLFEGSSHDLTVKPNATEFTGRKTVFSLRYRPATQTLAFFRKDMKDREFKGETKADLPSGRWTHVACTFEPGRAAVVYLDGRKALEVPLDGYVPLDLATDPLPNNTDVVDFHIGCGYLGASVRTRTYSDEPLMTGEVDLWRVSSGVRYRGGFAPAKAFEVDADTRAFFGFDDAFDGVSGGGIGVVYGTMRATSGRRSNLLEVDGRKVAYFPADITPENDPDKVLDRLTFPRMPDDEELHALRRPMRKTFTMRDGDRVRVDVAGKAYPDFVEIANRGAEPLVFPVVLNDGDVDPRSFGDFAESLDCMNLSDREKVNRTFNFLLKASDYFIADTAVYEADSNVPECVMPKALTMINGYCGFECGPLNTMAANLFACSARCPANMTGGYAHSFQQVFFEGRNHIYDLSAQKFFPGFDNETSVYLEQDDAEPGVHFRMGGSPAHFIRHGARTFSATDPGYRLKVGVSLNPGERFRAWFDNAAYVNDLFCSPRLDGMIRGKTRNFFMPYATYGKETFADEKRAKMRRMERFFPQYGNGFLEFEGAPSAANPAFVDEGASFRYRVASGYPIVAGEYVATRKDGSVAPNELSFDGGKTWTDVGVGELTYPVRTRLAYWVRVKAAMKDVAAFRARTTVLVNPRVFPGKVREGKNEFRFKAVSGGAAEVTVAWREPAGRIDVEGAVATGTVPGAEKLTVVIDPAKGPASFTVKGVSPKAVAEPSAGLVAKMEDGRLVVSAVDAAKPLVGHVTIRDGAAERGLAVVSCPGSRFVSRPPVRLDKADERAEFAFEPLPAGEYMVMSVVRFASHPSDLLGTYLSLELDAEPRTVKNASAAVNPHANYLKAHYGQKGGRANWKWDFTLDPKTFRPFWGPQAFKVTKPLDKVAFVVPAKRGPEGGAEVAAAFVLPFPESEFRCALEKVLCGVNSCPERVK